jgi:glycosyltransferase involved in cell wall biosynthesis
VLLVNNFGYISGGADTHCFRLYDALAARGHEVRLLATRSDYNVVTEGAFVSCSVTHETRHSLRPAARARVALKAIWNREAYTATKRLIDEFQPDVVHAHKLYPQLSCAPLVAARRVGTPVVQTLQDYEFVSASALDDSGGILDRHEDRFSFRILNDATFVVRRFVHRPLVTRWVAVSEYVAGVYARAGIQTTIVPNFVDPMARPAPPPGPAAAARSGIAFIGRLRPEKGVATVIRLAAVLRDVSVTLAGWGPLADEVRSAAAEMPNLTFLGRLDQEGVGRLLRSARVMVMPSEWSEPGALSVLDAFVEGTPVVTFDRGGAADYVRLSGGGRVVHASLDALGEACLRLARDDREWAAASERARSAAAGPFSAEVCVDQIERVYAAAIASRQ